jgi:hypothetical protein
MEPSSAANFILAAADSSYAWSVSTHVTWIAFFQCAAACCDRPRRLPVEMEAAI